MSQKYWWKTHAINRIMLNEILGHDTDRTGKLIQTIFKAFKFLVFIGTKAEKTSISRGKTINDKT